MPDTEQRFDYGGGLVAYQRPCDAGCDEGLLFAPARFCPTCRGDGRLVRWERDGRTVNGPDEED